MTQTTRYAKITGVDNTQQNSTKEQNADVTGKENKIPMSQKWKMKNELQHMAIMKKSTV